MSNQLTEQQAKRIEQEAIEKYCSPYGKANPETYAYIEGATTEALRNMEVEKENEDNKTRGEQLVQECLTLKSQLEAEALRARELVEALFKITCLTENDLLKAREIATEDLKNYQQ